MAFKARVRTVFVYGFAKRERDNIGPDELDYWRRVADAFTSLSEAQLAALTESKELTEVSCNGKDRLSKQPP